MMKSPTERGSHRPCPDRSPQNPKHPALHRKEFHFPVRIQSLCLQALRLPAHKADLQISHLRPHRRMAAHPHAQK